MADVAALLSLLQILYPPPSTPLHLLPSQYDQALAQKTLYEAIASPVAWALAGEVLDAVGREPWGQDPNARFIAAHMLGVKISRDWATLPEQHRDALKTRLLQWLGQSARRTYPPDSDCSGGAGATGEKVVLRKLGVAVAALSLRMVPPPEASWPNWLLEVISQLAAPPKPRPEALVEFLTIVVEEAQRADLIGIRRAQYDQSLTDAGSAVVAALSSALNERSSPTLKALALQTAQIWLASTYLPITAPADLWPLLLASLTDLREGLEEVVIRAAECVEELVSASGSGTSASGFVTRARAEALLDWFAGPVLGSVLEAAIAVEDCSDALLGLIKLLVSLAEHSTSALAHTLTSPRTLELLSRLLKITTFPGWHGIEETVSSLPLPVWTLLQEELVDSGALGEEAGVLGQVQVGKVAKDIYTAVAEGLLSKARWPKESELTLENGWTNDAIKSFRLSRWDVGEAMLSAYYVLREELLGRWVSEVERLSARPQAEGESYEDLEAVLHCICVVQEAVPPEEAIHLPRLFSHTILGSVPTGDSAALLRLRIAMLKAIGAYAEWFKGRRDQLLMALDYVVPSLSSRDEETVSRAANALRRLCDEGRKILVDHIAGLAGVIQSTEGRLPMGEYEKVLQSTASVLQALPAEQQAGPVGDLIRPILDRLISATKAYSADPGPNQQQTLINTLNMLCACARGLSEPEEELLALDGPEEPSYERTKAQLISSQPAIVSLRAQASGAILSALKGARGDTDVTVVVSELLRACTFSDLPNAMSLTPFAAFVVCTDALVQDPPNAAALYSLATSLIVATHREGGENLSSDDGAVLMSAVKHCVGVATALLNEEAAVKDNPDVLQAFLHFCVAVTHSYIRIFEVLRDELEAITLVGIRGLALEERIALQASLGLLGLFIQHTRSHSPCPELFHHLLSIHGPEVLRRVLKGIGGALPRSTLPNLAEVLHSLVLRLPVQTRVWMTTLFDDPTFPSDKLSAERKTRFINQICGARTLKRARELANELASTARGLDGTAYGASVLSLSL